MKTAVFLDGPIGVGKTTLGRAAAARLGATFLDADDFSDPDKRWFEDILTASRALRAAILAAPMPLVVLAKPLRQRDWCWFSGHLARAGVTARCIGLTASLPAILAPARGRGFSVREAGRIAAMIDQGYGRRPFRHATLATDAGDLAGTAARLATLIAAVSPR